LLAGRGEEPDVELFTSGELELLRRPSVSVVGTREVSDDGWSRAWRLARELAEHSVTVVSGLARGVDTAVLTGAIEKYSKVVAVIGTPIDQAYAIENAALQEKIYRNYLLISQFPVEERVFPSNFRKRAPLWAAFTPVPDVLIASDGRGARSRRSAGLSS